MVPRALKPWSIAEVIDKVVGCRRSNRRKVTTDKVLATDRVIAVERVIAVDKD